MRHGSHERSGKKRGPFRNKHLHGAACFGLLMISMSRQKSFYSEKKEKTWQRVFPCSGRNGKMMLHSVCVISSGEIHEERNLTMFTEYWAVFGIGILLGFRHALEPDHMIAVSTIASRTGSVGRAALSGVYWGIGHTLSLLAVGMLIIGIRLQVSPSVEAFLEGGVGVMLIVLGILSIRSLRRKKVHAHYHVHADEYHIHFHDHQHGDGHDHPHAERHGLSSLVVGMIHGVAGSGALALMTMATIDSTAGAALYITLFGLGTILGMMLFAAALALPFAVLSKRKTKVTNGLGMATACLSMLYGCYYIYEIWTAAA
jgi:ABC-type nickel/cobalt efflux system permease component RcnA